MASGLISEAFPAAGVLRASRPGASPTRRGVAVPAAEPGVLFAALRPEVNLAVWHRELPAGFAASLRDLAAAAPFETIAGGAPGHAVASLAGSLPAPAPIDLLLDIHDLAVAFAAVAGSGGAVRVRLEATADRSCPRWHADGVGLRLLCTYRGPGTEWLPLAGGAAAASGLPPGGPAPGRAARLPTGAVAILKGEAYPGNSGWGCVHRSPPAAPGGRARLLLCLDEPGRIPPG